MIGFPALVDNLALVYNTKLFDEAGLDYPDPDWTWDDFRAAAQALNDPDNEVYGTATSVSGGEDTTWRLWPQLWQNGGQILNDDETKAEFNSDAGVEALELWRTMAVDDKTRLPRPDRRADGPAVRRRPGRDARHRAVAALRLRGGQDAVRRGRLPGRTATTDGLRPGHLGGVRPQGRQPRLLDDRAAQVADLGRDRRAVQPRARQPAAARLGGGHARRTRSSSRSTRASTCSSTTSPTPRSRGRRSRQYVELSRYVGTAVSKVLQGKGTRPRRSTTPPSRLTRRCPSSDHRQSGLDRPGRASETRALARVGPGPGWAFAGPATLVVLALSIFPALWAFYLSRRNWDGITPSTPAGWSNYERLADDPQLRCGGRAHAGLHGDLRAGVDHRSGCCSPPR